jgi:alginate O-acetyltransferase complex protein AlgI
VCPAEGGDPSEWDALRRIPLRERTYACASLLFPTATFAIFFLVVLPLSWLTMPWPHRWRPFIVAASYVFYSWWDWRFIFLLAGCTLWNQVLAVRIWRARVRAQRKALLALALAGNLAVLGYFKYYDFFVTSTDNLLSVVGLDVPLELKSIVLPVGISFYTFMAISYVVDAYRGDFEPTTLEKFAVYLSFFPHLVAGPIVRPAELIPQIDTPRNPRRVDTSRAFYLIATGLFKKVVIANYLASSIVDEVFGAPGQHSSLEILIAVYAYAVQIYADFSGYTDIAIGIALLLGFTFPQNFDSPYAAVSVQDFWRRWHMTLSRWLRDYVYIPLGGNRGGTILTYRNLMLTMLIGGLWHGAAWTFVVWGGLHGAALVYERWRSDRLGGQTPVVTGWARWRARLLTFHFVCFAWIFFRSDSFDAAWEMIKGLFTQWGEPSPLVTSGVLLAIAAGIGSQYLPARIPRLVMARFSRLPVLGQATVLALSLMLTSVMGPEGVAPFIYFQF